jgi:hypothetical protein
MKTKTFSQELLAHVPKSMREHRALIKRMGIIEPRPVRRSKRSAKH